jgi:hypothetical protein
VAETFQWPGVRRKVPAMAVPQRFWRNLGSKGKDGIDPLRASRTLLTLFWVVFGSGAVSRLGHPQVGLLGVGNSLFDGFCSNVSLTLRPTSLMVLAQLAVGSQLLCRIFRALSRWVRLWLVVAATCPTPRKGRRLQFGILTATGNRNAATP